MNRKAELVRRVRAIRQHLYGADGLEALAGALGLPAQTWRKYERGITMPAQLFLEFLALTAADPNWLLTGAAERLSAEVYPLRSGTVR